MVDPVTPNIGLAVPIRASDVGTWDVPVNGDFTILDNCMGGVTTLALSSASVTLASSQAYNNVIRLTGALTTNISINLPSIYKFWTVDNQLTNSPSFAGVVLVSTSGLNQIGLPPGQTDVFYDGTTVNYRNLGKLGEYWDYASDTVPRWVSLSTKAPYLLCNGTTFSSATYPQLANLIGTTLPDAAGRARAALNAGTGRLTSGVSGVDGNTIFAAGGNQNMQAHTHTVTDPGHTHALQGDPNGTTGLRGSGGAEGFGAGTRAEELVTAAVVLSGAVTGISNQTTGTGSAQNVQPTYIGGITMIRAM